jgi:hypothetical protein
MTMAVSITQTLRRWDLNRFRPLVWITALLMTISATRIIYETRNYYFFSDDFLNFIVTTELHLGRPLLFHDWIGELIPLYGVIHWVYLKLFGVVFWPFRVMLVLFQWSVILLTARFGQRRGLHPAILIPALTILTLSPIYGTPYQWYSAALQVLGEGLAGLAAIYVFAVPGRLTPYRFLAGSLLYMTGMFLFPKGLFVAGLLFGVRWFAAASQGLALRSAILRAMLDISLILAMGIAYMAAQVLGHHSSGVPVAGPALTLHYIWVGWNTGFLTGVLGLDQPFPGRVILANLIFAAIVAASIWRNPRTVTLWVSFGVYFFVTMAAVAINRAMTFGLESAETPRYFTDILGFFVAYTLVAFAHPPGFGRRALTRVQFAAVAALTAACGAFWLAADSRVPYLWDRPKRNEAFVQNVKDAIRQTGPTAKIADTKVPDWVMPQWIWPLTQYRYFLLIFPNHGRVVPAADADFIFTSDGTLQKSKGK